MGRLHHTLVRITFTFIAFAEMFAVSCSRVTPSAQQDEMPDIFPDYAGVTVPANIAPLNFSWLGEGQCAVTVRAGDYEFCTRGRDGLFRFPSKVWKNLAGADEISFTVMARQDGGWVAFRPFNIYVSKDEIDPWISYRLIPPGYQGWRSMGLYQRELGSYMQKTIIENSATDYNCMNCHSYSSRNPRKMLFHARAEHGGTILIQDGEIEKLNTRTDSTISALVYPYWHPSEKFIAFSVNTTLQSFFNHDPNRIEVFDKASDVVVYDVEDHSIFWSPQTKSEDRFETFPTFSPDGRWLYFCSAEAVEDMPADYNKVKYALMRIAFNPENCSFGDKLETVFDAPAFGKSVSFPRISPDGRFLAFTLHGYGNFSIWHKDADICLLDLESGELLEEPLMNSSDVDSYHSWSGNGRWLLFSSRRDDGLYTKPYIAHIDAVGQASKPFLLPQENPRKFYHDLMFSYNIPEFISDEMPVPSGTIVKAVRELKEKKIEIGQIK